VVLRQFTARTALLVVFETALIMGAVALAAWLRLGNRALDLVQTEQAIPKGLLIAAVCQLCLYYAELYDLRIVADRANLWCASCKRWVGRHHPGSHLFLAAGSRYRARSVPHCGRARVRPRHRMAARVRMGIAPDWASRAPAARGHERGLGCARAELHARRHELGVEIVGFVDPDRARVGAPVVNPGVIGTVADIPKSSARTVWTVSSSASQTPAASCPWTNCSPCALAVCASTTSRNVYEQYTGKIAVENLRPSWLLFSEGSASRRCSGATKRTVDVSCAALGLVLAAPLMLLVALAVKLTSAGPALYHQERVGQHNRVFTVHKFRSMRQDAEATTGAVWARKNDERVTPVGGFLRRTAARRVATALERAQGRDELRRATSRTPGVRGPAHRADSLLRAAAHGEAGRHRWAQVSYTYGASVEDALEKLQYDLFYIKNLSIGLDLFVVFKTVQTVLLSGGGEPCPLRPARSAMR